jgi:hypothetical protein
MIVWILNSSPIQGVPWKVLRAWGESIDTNDRKYRISGIVIADRGNYAFSTCSPEEGHHRVHSRPAGQLVTKKGKPMNKLTLKFLTFVSLLVASSACILLLLLGARMQGPQERPYSGNENHMVSLDLAVKYIHNFTAKPTAPSIKGGYFGRNIFEKLLAENGCVGIRYYYATTDSGVATIVLVGVDSSGNDLYQGILAEETLPCPPWCPSANPLNK